MEDQEAQAGRGGGVLLRGAWLLAGQLGGQLGAVVLGMIVETVVLYC
jgi:hypothetical protein